MAPRPNWKGFLKLSLVSCSISLYPATSPSERVSFNQINKNTGNRIRYKKVDGDTGEEVNQPDIVKGYQVEKNVYVTVEDEELEALQVDSSHTIEIDKFVPRRTSTSDTSTPLLHRAERRGRPGCFCRHPRRDEEQGDGRPRPRGYCQARATDHSRTVGQGPARYHAAVSRTKCATRAEYFDDIPDVKVSADMLKLAEHIVESKAADFDPSELVDHYEIAVVEMLKEKQAGKTIRKEAHGHGSERRATSSTC